MGSEKVKRGEKRIRNPAPLDLIERTAIALKTASKWIPHLKDQGSFKREVADILSECKQVGWLRRFEEELIDDFEEDDDLSTRLPSKPKLIQLINTNDGLMGLADNGSVWRSDGVGWKLIRTTEIS